MSKIEKVTILEVFTLVIQSLIHILGYNIASAFKRYVKLKFCFRNSLLGTFGAKMWVQVGSKVTKTVIFIIIPAT